MYVFVFFDTRTFSTMAATSSAVALELGMGMITTWQYMQYRQQYMQRYMQQDRQQYRQQYRQRYRQQHKQQHMQQCMGETPWT
jgi:hypothetical protein